MHSTAVLRLKLETDLRRGLENGELIAYYQPIISLNTGKITGFEALSRWRRPEGLVPPAEFIPIADETGLIQPINRVMMREDEGIQDPHAQSHAGFSAVFLRRTGRIALRLRERVDLDPHQRYRLVGVGLGNFQGVQEAESQPTLFN